ncbi:hypothetical protein [Marichromatium gracile]|uniref:Chemotaxis protein n=1 Tax=Marichromatium gracile TaxID=1048 RepID=A0ABR5VJ89_MARGR|nr:hypothetical protein [Marichromatium gracile]KXX65647.1 hypothetical protein AY586_09185 [Marichromatium gracile]MBO8085322.1 hypothetical protein [Marichromatium sp.]
MARLLLVPVIIFVVLAGWVGVQQLYARFARRHPQLGPYRPEGGGCSCGSGHCEVEVAVPGPVHGACNADRH